MTPVDSVICPVVVCRSLSAVSTGSDGCTAPTSASPDAISGLEWSMNLFIHEAATIAGDSVDWEKLRTDAGFSGDADAAFECCVGVDAMSSTS